jgi:repressor of nif and glnA expression
MSASMSTDNTPDCRKLTICFAENDEKKWIIHSFSTLCRQPVEEKKSIRYIDRQEQPMDERKEKKILDILKILQNSPDPLASGPITEALENDGQEISERTVRMYLSEMEEEGLIETLGKKGRIITPKGRSEIEASGTLQRVGYLSARIDRMIFNMNFDLELRAGTVVVNTTVIPKKAMVDKLSQVIKVFDKGYAMGQLVGLIPEGSDFNGLKIPAGHVGFCTVCSITLNGVLLKKGVPVRSIFSGILELKKGQVTRFAEMINYDGTSIDPLELFIRGRLTDYLGAIRDGNGRIGAGFREIPSDSYELVNLLADRLTRIGLGAFLTIGKPNQPILNVPVREGCCGVIVIGGLNPVAVFEESGIPVLPKALSGLMEFHQLFPYTELADRLR